MAEGEGRSWVRELEPGVELNECYAVRAKELRRSRSGGKYLALTLSDRSGEVAALAWENVDRLASVCELGSVVRIRGQVQRYNQRLQIVLSKAQPVPADEVDEALFVRASAVDPQVLWRKLMQMVEELSDDHLKQLLFRVLSDPELAERFKVAPAARSMHHAFRSGLLEHTVSMTTAARLLAAHYGLHESLVVAGAVLHDLGKIWELEIDPTIEYTDDGRLLGHLTMEVMFVDEKIREMPSFPPELRRQLLHILLAHHGEYAYGSPRRPKTPEALLVHMADNLDAKMSGMLEALANDGDQEQAWSPFSRILDRFVYRRRVDEAPD